MNLGPNQLKWIEELESDHFTQSGRPLLRCDVGYCCLGVAEEIFNEVYKTDEDGIYSFGSYYDNVDAYSSQKVRKILKLTERGVELAASLNDRGTSFTEIAAYIRENPEEFFKETA